MIELKIKGSTPKSGPPLCTTCKHATFVRGQNEEQRVICGNGVFADSYGIVPFKVYECGAYHPSNVPWLHEMQQMAWKVIARKRGPVGFQSNEPPEMEVSIEPPQTPTRYQLPTKTDE